MTDAAALVERRGNVALITINRPEARKRLAYGADDGVIADEEPKWDRTTREFTDLLKSEDAREGPLAFAESVNPYGRHAEMGRVEDKVVLVTGGARGQGRSHAVKLAEEGADVILFDICENIDTNEYALATPRDLEEAGLEVEKTGRRAYTAVVDVRDRAAVVRELANAVAEFGKLDVVVANAGICPLGADLGIQAFADAFDVDFIGVVNTVHAALPFLKPGASIITTGSIAGLIAASQPPGAAGPQGPGGAGYSYAKQLVDSYTMQLAGQLASQSIRANVIHPTNVNTDMLNSAPMYRQFRPDLENPTRDDAILAFPAMQAMPTPYVEASDISNAVCFLASDESRFVTGLQFKVDAGAMLKF